MFRKLGYATLILILTLMSQLAYSDSSGSGSVIWTHEYSVTQYDTYTDEFTFLGPFTKSYHYPTNVPNAHDMYSVDDIFEIYVNGYLWYYSVEITFTDIHGITYTGFEEKFYELPEDAPSVEDSENTDSTEPEADISILSKDLENDPSNGVEPIDTEPVDSDLDNIPEDERTELDREIGDIIDSFDDGSNPSESGDDTNSNPDDNSDNPVE